MDGGDERTDHQRRRTRGKRETTYMDALLLWQGVLTWATITKDATYSFTGNVHAQAVCVCLPKKIRKGYYWNTWSRFPSQSVTVDQIRVWSLLWEGVSPSSMLFRFVSMGFDHKDQNPLITITLWQYFENYGDRHCSRWNHTHIDKASLPFYEISMCIRFHFAYVI